MYNLENHLKFPHQIPPMNQPLKTLLSIPLKALVRGFKEPSIEALKNPLKALEKTKTILNRPLKTPQKNPINPKKTKKTPLKKAIKPSL